jgi:hypothetical protein
MVGGEEEEVQTPGLLHQAPVEAVVVEEEEEVVGVGAEVVEGEEVVVAGEVEVSSPMMLSVGKVVEAEVVGAEVVGEEEVGEEGEEAEAEVEEVGAQERVVVAGVESACAQQGLWCWLWGSMHVEEGSTVCCHQLMQTMC